MEEIHSHNEDRSSDEPTPVPLVVDLDGTLVKTDLLIESLFSLIRRNFLYFFLLPFWLLRGKAYLKRRISERVTLDVSVLPFHLELLNHLKGQFAIGRRLVLATATDEKIARQVASHLQFFERVLGSDGTINLSGRCKRDRLVTEFGEKGFDYAGNDRRDLARQTMPAVDGDSSEGLGQSIGKDDILLVPRDESIQGAA